MADISVSEIPSKPQCQFYVQRKKRLCRMTVKPGRNYCGEHEPAPKTDDGQDDTRIPCPYDSQHTVYSSKLERHLLICNARPGDTPPYIVHDINAPPDTGDCVRTQLSQIPRETLIKVIEKINALYEKHIEGNIETLPPQPIHPAVLSEFSDPTRTEKSRRHLRQVSALLHCARRARLVAPHTVYVELGAGKGHLSYYAWSAFCSSEPTSGVLLIDRAALRHKRDGKLRGSAGGPLANADHQSSSRPRPRPLVARVRADLRHLRLERAPLVHSARGLVGIAKHLCGVATDYALRCVCAVRASLCAGALLATCCHHRCQRAHYVACRDLQEMGISGDDFNVMLGVVSWATCGDGKSRDRRARDNEPSAHTDKDHIGLVGEEHNLDSDDKSNNRSFDDNGKAQNSSTEPISINNESPASGFKVHNGLSTNEDVNLIYESSGSSNRAQNGSTEDLKETSELGEVWTQEFKASVGRRAKALIDWGRVLYLRGRGFDARLAYYVPTDVSLENVCIIATKNKVV